MTRRQPEQADIPVPREPPPSDPVAYFVLPGILPASYRFAYHERLFTLNLLCMAAEGPTLLGEQSFTRREASLLLPLLHAYPAYCPYAVLHAHLTHTIVTTQDIAHSQQRLTSVMRAGYSETEMRPIRNVLSRVRMKMLAAFHIDIVTIQQVGPLLMYAGPPATAETAPKEA